jgi:hypothetical protein
MPNKAKVSPVLFIATILFFFLPFVTVSCNSQKVASFSGVQLATGTTVEQPRLFGTPEKREVSPEPLATLAGICAFAGLGLSFLGLRKAVAPAASAGAGAFFLLLLKSELDGEMVRQGRGLFLLEYEPGYVMALLFS